MSATRHSTARSRVLRVHTESNFWVRRMAWVMDVTKLVCNAIQGNMGVFSGIHGLPKIWVARIPVPLGVLEHVMLKLFQVVKKTLVKGVVHHAVMVAVQCVERWVGEGYGEAVHGVGCPVTATA